MSPIYEDEYLPLERNRARKHRERQSGENNVNGSESERQRDNQRGDKETKPL